jgi:DNA-binding transcriptional ArsR family regulator
MSRPDHETAADAFAVLSDPSRVAILRELADRVQGRDRTSIEFSELRRAVDVDDPGRFNYHLGKLQDRFVVKHDDGYAPTAVGLKAIGSVQAGTYTEDIEPRSGHVDYDCPSCGEALTATYEDQVLTVECDEEYGTFVQTPVPPSVAADADLEDVVSFVVGDIQRDIEALTDGACPICSGAVTPTEFYRGESELLKVRLECANCWMETEIPVGLAVLRHPAVVSLYYDHGVDVRDRFVTDLAFVESRGNAEVVADDPIAVELTVALEGDELTFRIDDELNAEAL